jgi:hypothetical protein
MAGRRQLCSSARILNIERGLGRTGIAVIGRLILDRTEAAMYLHLSEAFVLVELDVIRQMHMSGCEENWEAVW